MINKLSKEIHAISKSKGFYDEPVLMSTSLCLIHSEVSEALEADRVGEYCKENVSKNALTYEDDKDFKYYFESNVKDTFEDELADVIIRALDLAGSKGIDIESHVLAKMRYNSLRPAKHGKRY